MDSCWDFPTDIQFENFLYDVQFDDELDKINPTIDSKINYRLDQNEYFTKKDFTGDNLSLPYSLEDIFSPVYNDFAPDSSISSNSDEELRLTNLDYTLQSINHVPESSNFSSPGSNNVSIRKVGKKDKRRERNNEASQRLRKRKKKEEEELNEKEKLLSEENIRLKSKYEMMQNEMAFLANQLKKRFCMLKKLPRQNFLKQLFKIAKVFDQIESESVCKTGGKAVMNYIINFYLKEWNSNVLS